MQADEGSGEGRGGMARRRLSLAQIWNMCCGLFGVQIVWGMQNASTSRIFQTLGAEISQLPILWIAAPITGLLVQPLIGYWSDRTWGRLGRRRPFLLAGALLTAGAMIAMPNVHSVWTASIALWILTAAINVAAEPFRALVADTLPEEQRTDGFAVQVFFIGAGAVIASALPWILANMFGVAASAPLGALPNSVRYAFYVGSIGLVVTVGWTVITTKERPPEALRGDADEADHAAPTLTGIATLRRSGWIWTLCGLFIAIVAWAEGLERELYVLAAIGSAFGLAQLLAVRMRRNGYDRLGIFEIVEDILHMPSLLRRLAVVQFFTWFGLFAMWIYAVPAIAVHVKEGSIAGSAGYNAVADWVGVLFAGYNGVAALAALALPRISIRLGKPVTHALALLLGALGLFGYATIEDAQLLWLPTIGIGCAWASILSLPYAMLASAVPSHKMGVYMGIHNMFLVLPQLAAATILGAIVSHLFEGRAELALGLAAFTFAMAAASALSLRHD